MIGDKNQIFRTLLKLEQHSYIWMYKTRNYSINSCPFSSMGFLCNQLGYSTESFRMVLSASYSKSAGPTNWESNFCYTTLFWFLVSNSGHKSSSLWFTHFLLSLGKDNVPLLKDSLLWSLPKKSFKKLKNANTSLLKFVLISLSKKSV